MGIRTGAAEEVKLAIDQLSETKEIFTSRDIEAVTGRPNNYIRNSITWLFKTGYINKINRGLYSKAGKIKTEEKKSPLEESINTLNKLPDVLAGAIESIVDLVIEPEMEIINLIERRNRRIQDLEVLLNKSRIDLSNSRAKIQELTTLLNKISSQKNRVIPEVKILVRN